VSPPRPGRGLLAAYALPALPLSMPTIPAFVLLPSFYAQDLGLGLAATGGILLAARALDVASDPLVGLLSDRSRGRFGRRKPWIAVGAILAGVALVRLFDPPAEVGVLYLFAWSALLYLGWTLVNVPYLAWGAELSDDYHQRSRIAGAREALGILGILLAGSAPLVAAAWGYGQATALAGLAWLVVALGGASVILLLLRVPERRAAAPAAVAPRLLLQGLRRNAPFQRLLAAWMVNGMATGLAATLFPLYTAQLLGAGDTLRGALLLLYFAAAVAAVPLWLLLSRRIGKHRTWCVAMLLACAAFVWTPFLGADGASVAAFVVICAVTGAALGADLALPPAMQADVVDYETLCRGEARPGLFFALWSMGTKLSLALAVGIAFPALALLGFDPRAEDGGGREGLLALALAYGGLPVLLKLVAIALVWRHPLTESRHALIRRRLDRRAVAPAVPEARP